MAHGSSDKLPSLSSPLSSMSACCAELSGDTPFIGLALRGICTQVLSLPGYFGRV